VFSCWKMQFIMFVHNLTMQTNMCQVTPVTPQCVLCEVHPKTACGYVVHLKKHHKTTLKACEIYLTCACGLNHTTHNDYKKNDKKCSGLHFTLQKLENE
ncbi:hypothetical protein PMAYCL1PPCAC_20850, partial [Pristionchus mayeri]